MAVVVVAELVLQPGTEEEAKPRLEELCEKTHANDEGCILYALHSDPEDSTRFVVIEKWESAEALQAHGEAEHIAAMRSLPFASPPNVMVLEAVAFGDPGKGLL